MPTNTDYLKTVAQGLTAPTDYLKQQFEALNQQYSLNMDVTGVLAPIVKWLATLPESEQTPIVQSVIAQLKTAPSSELLGGNTAQLSQTWLARAQAAGQQATQAAAAASTAAATAPGTPSSAQTTATTTATTPQSGQLSETTWGDTGAGVKVEGPSGPEPAAGTGTPTGFNEILSTYYQQQITAAGTDPTALAQVAGVTPQMLMQQYASYQQNSLLAQGPPGVAKRPEQGNQTMTLPQFAQIKAQSMMGPWSAVLAAIQSVYQSQMDQPMPADLVAQVITQLNQLQSTDPTQAQTILYNAYNYMENSASAATGNTIRDIGGTNTTTLLASLPSSIMTYGGTGGVGTGSVGTTGVVGTYAAVHPSPFMQTETVDQNIAAAFQKAFYRAPTAADMAALGTSPTPAQIQTYIDNQPMPGYPGMTYGAFTAANSQLTPLWQQYFGHDPTPQQLKWAVGKSSQDITDFIDNSQSSVPGVTIGVKNNYETFINSLDQANTQGASGMHTFSSGIDDSMIKQLHDHLQSQSTGTATPGAMK
jgi:hypothetical protein